MKNTSQPDLQQVWPEPIFNPPKMTCFDLWLVWLDPNPTRPVSFTMSNHDTTIYNKTQTQSQLKHPNQTTGSKIKSNNPTSLTSKTPKEILDPMCRLKKSHFLLGEDRIIDAFSSFDSRDLIILSCVWQMGFG